MKNLFLAREGKQCICDVVCSEIKLEKQTSLYKLLSLSEANLVFELNTLVIVCT